MAAQFVVPARVDELGVLRHDANGRFGEVCRQFAGQRVELVFRKPKSKRTLDQNSYWWAEPVPRLAEHCGYSPNQMHYALLGECFGYTPGPTGQAIPVKASSSDLSVEEFRHLIDWVLVWAPSELGVAIQSPDEWQIARAA